jgi:V8-like Glu-specific endopeptidase
VRLNEGRRVVLGGRARRWAAIAGATIALITVGGEVGEAPASASSVPMARALTGVAPVGALFFRSASGRLGHHFCSASVVNSPGGDLIITAAHCMTGRRPGTIAFVPGYHDGHEPYGMWVVTGILRDVKWSDGANPDHDVAFLTVRRPHSTAAVQSLTGGEGLAASRPGERVWTVGYPDKNGKPVSCANTVRAFSSGQLEFDCGGFPDGTSGGPMLTDVNPATGLGLIVGVIGGYQQGGDTDSVSYAARFGRQVSALYDKATSRHREPRPAVPRHQSRTRTRTRTRTRAYRGRWRHRPR